MTPAFAGASARCAPTQVARAAGGAAAAARTARTAASAPGGARAAGAPRSGRAAAEWFGGGGAAARRSSSRDPRDGRGGRGGDGRAVAAVGPRARGVLGVVGESQLWGRAGVGRGSRRRSARVSSSCPSARRRTATSGEQVDRREFHGAYHLGKAFILLWPAARTPVTRVRHLGHAVHRLRGWAGGNGAAGRRCGDARGRGVLLAASATAPSAILPARATGCGQGFGARPRTPICTENKGAGRGHFNVHRSISGHF